MSAAVAALACEQTPGELERSQGACKRLSLKQGTGNGGTGNEERGTGNGESLKGGISKRGNL